MEKKEKIPLTSKERKLHSNQKVCYIQMMITKIIIRQEIIVITHSTSAKEM